MKRKKSKQFPSAERPLLIRFAILVFAIWLLVCFLLSAYVLADIREQLSNDLQAFGQEVSFTHYIGFDEQSGQNRIYNLLYGPGGASSLYYARLEQPLPFMLSSSQNRSSLLYRLGIGTEKPYKPFFIFWSEDNPEIVLTSENSAAFRYSIVSGSREDGVTEGYCTSPNWNSSILREHTTYTGYFRGNRFVFAKEAPALYSLVVITASDDSVIQSDNSYIFQYRLVEGTLVGGATEGYCSTNNWYGKEQHGSYSVYRGYFMDDHFVFAEQAPAGMSLVDIAIYDEIHYDRALGSGSLGEYQYDNLEDLAKDLKYSRKYAHGDWQNKVIYQSGQSLNGEYTWLAGYVYQPLEYVFRSLFLYFLATFILALVMVPLLMRRIRYRFLQPIHRIVYAHDAKLFAGEKIWKEAVLLKEQFGQLQQQVSESKAEIQRLSTALEYAADAEENRRQLVSNLTHELKTPLAVIHSYAEGLQAGIAKDKQDRYLSIITEESERMDAMVLEMLDLSRLEAGRVKLTLSRFSLLDAAKSVTDKFAPMLEARNLTLAYDLEEDISITADEERILQVITNLVSNAFKYAPMGSQILVRVGYYSESNHFHVQQADEPLRICFTIENSAEPLSDEALEKVWSSFYRTDPSRNEPGTGLGLAIVKSIIDLHGGTCIVRNTLRVVDNERKTGVEFGFTLPLN